MKSNYEEALAAVLKWEGGWSNHPSDPGGATMRGVTQAVYDAYRRGEHINQRSVKLITERELQEIYRKQYWDVVRGDDLPAGVDYAVFDYAVNSGPKKAAIELQRVLNIAEDGNIGPITINAAGFLAAPLVINHLCDARLRFLRKLSTWGTFGKGWENRVKGVRTLALSLAKTHFAKNAKTPKPPEKSVEAVPSLGWKDIPPIPLPEQKASGGLLAVILRLIMAVFGGTRT